MKIMIKYTSDKITEVIMLSTAFECFPIKEVNRPAKTIIKGATYQENKVVTFGPIDIAVDEIGNNESSNKITNPTINPFKSILKLVIFMIINSIF